MKVVELEIMRESKDDFSKFLQQCKRAINTLYSYMYSEKMTVKIDKEVWSSMVDGHTLWQELKKTGSVSYVENERDYLLVIDFIFENHIYVSLEKKEG